MNGFSQTEWHGIKGKDISFPQSESSRNLENFLMKKRSPMSRGQPITISWKSRDGRRFCRNLSKPVWGSGRQRNGYYKWKSKVKQFSLHSDCKDLRVISNCRLVGLFTPTQYYEDRPGPSGTVLAGLEGLIFECPGNVFQPKMTKLLTESPKPNQPKIVSTVPSSPHRVM